jgi:hypothetical protein
MDRGLDRKQRAKTKWFRNEMKTDGGKRNGLKTKWFYLVHDFIDPSLTIPSTLSLRDTFLHTLPKRQIM